MPNNESTDYIIRLQKNPSDEEAASRIVNAYWNTAFKTARSQMAQGGIYDDAICQDMVQESWIKIFSKISRLKEPAKFKAWMCAIVRNTCTDYLKSAVNRHEDQMPLSENDEGEEIEYDPSDERMEFQPEMAYSNQARAEIIADILGDLNTDQRKVVMMYFFDGMSLKQIAEALSIPMSTVVGRMNTAKTAIKSSVSDLQKRDDIKLYNLSPLPFFLYLLDGWKQEQAEAPQGFAEKALKEAGAHKAGTAASVSASRAATAIKAVSASAKVAAGMTIGTKIAIAATAVALAFGGGYGIHAVVSSNQPAHKEQPPVEEPQIIEEQQTIEEPSFAPETSVPDEPRDDSQNDNSNTQDEPVDINEDRRVIWIKEPDMDLTEVRELNMQPAYFSDVIYERTGYAPEWAENIYKFYYNSSTPDAGTHYISDAIEVARGKYSGIYDYSGNTVYPLIIPEAISEFDVMEELRGVVAWANYYVTTEDTGGEEANAFTSDFTGTYPIPAGGLGGDAMPERHITNGQTYKRNWSTGKDSPFSWNERTACLMEEWDTDGSYIDYRLVTPDGSIYEIAGEYYERIINGFLAVEKDEYWGFQSARNGKLITDHIYDEVKYFENGYAPVKKNGKWGYIDEKGNEVTDFIFDNTTVLYEGRCYVSVRGKYGIMDLASTLKKGIPVTAGTCQRSKNHSDSQTQSKEETVLGFATVNIDNLNVRKEPSAKAEKAAASRSIAKGTSFPVTEITEAEGYTWYRIGENRWIADNGKWVTYRKTSR